MKATGIVRRIDELGRVVIPKEIRRTQRIRRGDPLEIFTTGDGEVIFKKYSPMGELSGVDGPVRGCAEQVLCPDGLCLRPGPHSGGIRCGQAGTGRPQRQPAAGKADGQPQALPERWRAPKRRCCPVRAHPGRCCALCPSLRRGMSPAVWACLRRTALPSPMPPSSRR